MKKNVLLLVVFFAMITTTFSQRLLTWTPEFPNDNSTLTFTVDCTKGNQGLLNYANTADVYVHVGVNTNLSTGPTDWRYVKFPNFNVPTPAAQATFVSTNKYSFTITNIRAFFGVPAGETINKVNILFRNGAGTLKQTNTDISDMYLPVYAAGQFAVRLNLPPFEPRFIPYPEPINVLLGNQVAITGVASNNAALTLKLNGNTINTAANATTISANPTMTVACEQKIMLEGNDGTGLKKDSFSFYINPTTNIAALPTGAIEGINYLPGNTAATLVLYAPNKTSVNIIGDFNNWTASCAGQMNKTPDGNYYWITVNGLTPGTEYAYQYLVDNTIRVADPYTQKVLDPNNDQFINSVTYPNLKPYPTGLTTGIVGILQTAEPAYSWTTTNFVKPDKRNLMTYELLIRDFTAEHSYQSLIDSINYLKGIGINAIELMPINEFDGNESWGYNPSFYFAPDKYYGPKNKLKQFIDVCHANGIAVILDIVYNHCTGNAPQAALYWNSATNQPAANNPWLNVTATHPYSVFNDFNHNSTATKYLFQRNLNFWLDEYKVDGFRFDLAKGFSQTITNTTTVENYDPARVANLKYYYDNSVPTHPNTYMILEFLGSEPNQEEQEYVAHGFMTWGNINTRYSQCTMGYTSNSDISAVVYSSSQRAFSNPGLMGYMQSHDEERTMYRNLQFGNSAGPYDVKVLATALAREEAAAAVFFTVPGPKMIWQFEERGYDVSINFGGSNVANKPPRWEYMLDPNRRRLYDAYKKMIDLRLNNPAVFNNTTFTYDFFNGGGLVKTFQIADPNAAGRKVTVVANLDVVQQTKSVTFQATGDWINYISNGPSTGINGATNATFNLTNASQTITLAPGEYHIYISAPVCATPAPTVTTPVTYCQGATAIALTATGTNLLWYTTATGGTGSSTAPVPSTTTTGSVNYYVSQTLNGCEGPRAVIVVTINTTPPEPFLDPGIILPIVYCQGATAVPLPINTAPGYFWYTSLTGGVGSPITPTPSTAVVGTTNYYIGQTFGVCESNRIPIPVVVNGVAAAPTVISPIFYCQNATALPLTATGTNILWYTTATGGTGSITAPTPNTAIIGSITYYVSQSSNNCEGPRASIVVTVNAIPLAPTVSTPVTYCQNAIATALTAIGTNLRWYTTATGGVGNTIAPIPSTTTIGSTIFYVSQTTNNCESPRAAITVTITATTPAPTVTSSVNYCQNAIATALTATGTNLLWYTTATGGVGSATAPTPSTVTVGSTIFYVSQTQTCGESPRAAITVNVNAIPNAPVVTSPVVYCQNATAVPLVATGTNLLWYSTPSGGGGTATTPTPSTTTVGTVTYYVSQTVNGCEGPRAALVVTINAIPTAPIVSTPVTYCQNVTATALTATGTNLLWYATATGGAGTSTAPIPTTTTVGSTIYYVSQSANGCESPRAAITVTITPATPAPTVASPVNYCQNTIATALTASGTNLLWYTTATGGVGSATAPTPNTATAGSTVFYVSQTQTCGESPRAAITVNVNAIPISPVVTSPVVYCQNATAIALVATGTNLLWYSTPTGGGGTATTPTPSTTTVGTVTYYVSQTVNGCEGPRAAIVVTVNATPLAPTVSATVAYCQNATATALTATGTNLKWYTAATGGVGSSTAPIPLTTAAGITNYYVSQTLGLCEGPRAVIAVTVTALPVSATVISPVLYCQNATATALAATGTGLLWFTTATGGTGTATAPIPSTTTAGNTNYFVAQTNGCGEGPRANIIVTTTATPAAPTGLNVTTITSNSVTLNWTGIGTNFYTVEYKLASATSWIIAATGLQASTYNLTGLALGGNYDWRVSANCSAIGNGNTSVVSNFGTLSRNITIAIIKDGLGIKVSPNPLTSSAIIDYLVPAASKVSIDLLDKSGKRIRTLFEGIPPAGIGQNQLDVTNKFNILAKAVYYIRLQQDGKEISTQIIKL